MAAYIAVLGRRRRGKTVKRERRNPLQDLPDNLLIAEYRLSRRLILELCEILRPKLARDRRGGSLSVEQRVLICLRVLATGSFQNNAKEYVNVSQPTVSVTFDRFLDALGEKVGNYIYMPTDPVAGMQKFYNISRFPGVIGAIDGTHVAIMAPSTQRHLYVGRKGYHTINVQAVCDADLVFLDVVAQWSGGTSDAFILQQSRLFEQFENGEFGLSVLLGDSGYPLKTWLLTPYSNPSTSNQEIYNEAHENTHSVVKRAFEVLKKRWRILDHSSGHLCYAPIKACKIFVCCAILHNICQRNNIPLLEPIVAFESEDEEDAVLETDGTAVTLRDAVAATISSAAN